MGYCIIGQVLAVLAQSLGFLSDSDCWHLLSKCADSVHVKGGGGGKRHWVVKDNEMEESANRLVLAQESDGKLNDVDEAMKTVNLVAKDTVVTSVGFWVIWLVWVPR